MLYYKVITILIIKMTKDIVVVNENLPWLIDNPYILLKHTEIKRILFLKIMYFYTKRSRRVKIDTRVY